jgi:hypothetical protein
MQDVGTIADRLSNSGTPRRVPLLLRMQMRLGNPFALFGWAFFGFGMIFWWVAGAGAELVPFSGDKMTIGEIVRVESTGIRINDQIVHELHYQWTGPEGETREGVSYAQRGGSWKKGRPVNIEYDSGKPSRSVIEGMRRRPSPWWVAPLVGVFPLVGLVFAVPSFMLAGRSIRLLRNGKLAMAKFTKALPTNIRVNHRRVYKYHYEFTADDGQTHTVTTKSHTGEGLTDGRASGGHTPRAADDDEYEHVSQVGQDHSTGTAFASGGAATGEPILYDPSNPANAVVLDGLPGKPHVGADGSIHHGSTLKAVGLLIIPLAAIVGHGTVYVVRLLT